MGVLACGLSISDLMRLDHAVVHVLRYGLWYMLR